jgi:nitrile hydratase subunit beta
VPGISPMPVRFQPGDPVEVLDLQKEGHVRTPGYVRRKCGTIHQFCGYFLNPEALSIGDASGPLFPLYRVGFPLNELWPQDPASASNDMLFIEIYDHWLAPATGAGSRGETRD